MQEHTPARATAPVDEEDPDYNPEPIDNLDPLIIGIKTLEKYMDKFDKELEELRELHLKGTAKDLNRMKRHRKNELESKCFEFEV